DIVSRDASNMEVEAWGVKGSKKRFIEGSIIFGYDIFAPKAVKGEVCACNECMFEQEQN
ncbi:hypothetical protein L7F22_020068, partial [Adiantum nelumboides]|nr:hypothetical protein [Adiantum nelumboides]